MLLRFIIVLGLLWPTSAVADDYAKRRATCTPMLTALYDDCSVQNIYRCADGSTYVESLDLEDLPHAMLFGPDYEIVYQRDIPTGDGFERVLSAPNPFSIETLLTTGRDTAQITILNSFIPGMRTESPMDVNTGMTTQTRSLSAGDFGVAESVEVMIFGFAGNKITISGTYLIDPVRRLMIEASASADFFGETMELPSVVDVVDETSPFFMSQSPQETCQDQLSSLTSDFAPQMENSHDKI